MTTRIRRILVAIRDLHQPPRLELRKAAEIARAAKAVVELFHAVGAVSRSALRRIFIGSTAEATLDKLTCDVLVLKPAGFQSSVGAREFKESRTSAAAAA